MTRSTTAFSYSAASTMTDSLNRIVTSFLTKSALAITGAEFMEMFVREEHQQIMSDAFRIANWENNFSGKVSLPADGGTMVLGFVTGVNIGVMPPSYGNVPARYDGPAFEKVSEWAAEITKVKRAHQIALKAIPYLNAKCGNLKAAQTMFPCLLTLLQAAKFEEYYSRDRERLLTDNQNRIDRTMRMKSVGSLPSIPPDWRRQLYDAASLINVLQMASAAPTIAIPRDGARIQLDSAVGFDNGLLGFLTL